MTAAGVWVVTAQRDTLASLIKRAHLRRPPAADAFAGGDLPRSLGRHATQAEGLLAEALGLIETGEPAYAAAVLRRAASDLGGAAAECLQMVDAGCADLRVATACMQHQAEARGACIALAMWLDTTADEQRD